MVVCLQFSAMVADFCSCAITALCRLTGVHVCRKVCFEPRVAFGVTLKVQHGVTVLALHLTRMLLHANIVLLLFQFSTSARLNIYSKD